MEILMYKLELISLKKRNINKEVKKIDIYMWLIVHWLYEDWVLILPSFCFIIYNHLNSF